MTKKTEIIICIIVVILAVVFWYYVLGPRHDRMARNAGGYEENTGESIGLPWEFDPSCNVAGVNLHGQLMTYMPVATEEQDFASGEYIYWVLDEAEKSSDIRAVILEIDSYGGSAVAAEELGNKIKSMEKPVIIVARTAAVSAGYWVASAGDRIFASELSDIGSIGVSMSYLDESKLNEREGYTWNSLSTGKFKDSGSDQKALTKDERTIFERDMKIIFDKFIRVVSENRGLSIEKVTALADGSSMLGKMALENGLIDAIGFVPEAKSYIGDTYSFVPKVCW